MANISKIQLSGTSYNLVDTTSGYATKTEVTNAITGATEIINGELDKKADKTELDGLFGYVTYDDNAKKILFKHSETGATIGEVDATDFIKDGMVDNVEVKDGKLVITFNTDSGKEDIEIEISKIFDASNYYSKDQADKQFGTLTEQNQLRSDLEDALGEIASLEADKQDKLEGDYVSSVGFNAQNAMVVKTKPFSGGSETESGSFAFKRINGTSVVGTGDITLPTSDDVNNAITAATEPINATLETKADKSDTYTKAEVDKKVADSGTFDATQYYTKSEVDAELAKKNQVISVEGDTLIIS